jgi:hypothetical protein
VLVLVAINSFGDGVRIWVDREGANGLGGVFDLWSLLDLWTFESVDAISGQQDGKARHFTG